MGTSSLAATGLFLFPTAGTVSVSNTIGTGVHAGPTPTGHLRVEEISLRLLYKRSIPLQQSVPTQFANILEAATLTPLCVCEGKLCLSAS